MFYDTENFQKWDTNYIANLIPNCQYIYIYSYIYYKEIHQNANSAAIRGEFIFSS